MLESLAARWNLSVGALVAIGALVAVQLALQIFSLVDLARRTRVARVPKWVWVLVIVLGELVGTVVYLAIGRTVPGAATEPVPRGPAGDRAKRAVDVLYGPREKK